MPYNAKILKYASNRENFGSLEETENVGVGYVGNAACGDMLKIYLKVDENQIITDIKVKSYGCGCAIASTALAAEKLKGRSVEAALQLTDKELADELELPGVKKHCSVLAQAAVKKAVENYKSKNSNNEYEFEVSKKQLMQDENEMKTGSGCCGGGSEVFIDQKEIKVPTNRNIKTMEELVLTEAAKKRLLQIVKLYPEAVGVVISSQAGGCAGNSYNLEVSFDVDSSMKSYIFDDLQIFVPKSSLMFVFGLTIDYQETETQAGFIFKNPNAKMCGCGSSFR